MNFTDLCEVIVHKRSANNFIKATVKTLHVHGHVRWSVACSLPRFAFELSVFVVPLHYLLQLAAVVVDRSFQFPHGVLKVLHGYGAQRGVHVGAVRRNGLSSCSGADACGVVVVAIQREHISITWREYIYKRNIATVY
jgi:hypothetical protein